MLITLGCNQSPIEWMLSASSLPVNRLIMREFVDKCALSVSEQQIHLYLRELISVENKFRPDQRKLIEEVLRYVPINARSGIDSNPPVDFTVPGDAMAGVDELLNSETFENAVGQLRRGANPGDQRDEVYNRTIGKLGRLAMDIILFDKFSGVQTVKYGKRSGMHYVFSRLAEAQPRVISIYTSESDGVSSTLIEENIRKIAQEAGIIAPGFRLELFVAQNAIFQRKDKEHKFPHNRHIRFNYGHSRSKVSLEIGNGLQIFSKQRLSEGESFSLGDSSVARNNEQIVRAMRGTNRIQLSA